MRLEKAIEILTLLAKKWKADYDDDDLQAVSLGIEALKRLQELRKYANHNPKWLLPGETEE